ncbi:hypothetical protein ACFXBB_35825 [Streptomyces scopuliridis]|uniref:ATP-dependent DNA ligase n=1 Tax=Streptomyces scopuliridis TaxID=452529 RepID=UPI0036C5A24E
MAYGPPRQLTRPAPPGRRPAPLLASHAACSQPTLWSGRRVGRSVPHGVARPSGPVPSPGLHASRRPVAGGRRLILVEWPVDVALARPVTQLPTGPWACEIKVDGHRTVLWRTGDGVRLQSRTGRDVTALWMDLAVAAMRLPPWVVLDGEAVIYLADSEGGARISFEAAQSRALSSTRRARELAARHPATYVAFDVLAHPEAGDLRPRLYTERRQVLLDVLAGVGPPIEPVWSTTDPGEALLWYEALEGTGGKVSWRSRSGRPTRRAVSGVLTAPIAPVRGRADQRLKEAPVVRPASRVDRGPGRCAPCRFGHRAGDDSLVRRCRR